MLPKKIWCETKNNEKREKLILKQSNFKISNSMKV